MNLIVKSLIAVLIALTFAGCAGSKGNNNLIKIFGGGSSTSSSNPKVQPIRLLAADEIRLTLSGKTFQYTRADGTGLITFNEDGSSAVQDDAKGSGSGTWEPRDGELCETINGGPPLCGSFKSTGDAYFSGKSRFVEMKIN